MRSPILFALSIAPLACAAPEPAAAPPPQTPAAPSVVVDLALPPQPPARPQPEPPAAAAAAPDPHLNREAALREGANFGLIGVIPTDRAGSGQSRPRGPRLRGSAIQVIGPLSPEVVHRVVHQGFDRFRSCYENGLRDNPMLQGRVILRLVIEQSGSVAGSTDGGSDLPHRGVVDCMMKSARSLSFPKVEGGRVTVLYPIMLDPGDR